MKICLRMLTSRTQLQNRSFCVVNWRRTVAKCTKNDKARAKRSKVLFFVTEYVIFFSNGTGRDGREFKKQ